MARPLRIERPGAVYHVTSRGNARQPIIVDDADRHAFLELLGAVVERFHWACHGYCLMDNHYHLLLETPEANLSRGMRELNGRYTQAYNRRHSRVGHLFQGRYKAILVDRDNYLLELCRYVVLNPVRAGMVTAPEDYPWSNYQATCGSRPRPGWLVTDWTLRSFAPDRKAAVRRYRQFVDAGRGMESPWKELRGQVILGDEAFVERLGPEFSRVSDLREVPRQQRFANRPGLDQLLRVDKDADLTVRDERIRQANREYGYSLSDIGRTLGLHYSTVSKAIARVERSRFKT